MENSVTLDKVEKVEKSTIHKYIVPKLQANTLFTFTSELNYILQPLKSKYISPRYCDENISYLKIKRKGKKINKIYYPMKCFCDINLHRIKDHLECYGFYGLAFTKEWGMNNGIQPIQYINPNSKLRKYYTENFLKSLKSVDNEETELEESLKSYILYQLMYMKPYEGNMKSRLNNKKSKKCFMDECEWRFIPDVSKTSYHPIYFDTEINNKGNLIDFSNSMIDNPNISLKFEYSDLKYIIVKSKEDFIKIITEISKLKIDQDDKNILISKIIVWDESGGDF